MQEKIFHPDICIFLAFGVAEPCSRLRRFGGALSERSEFARPPQSANRAGNPKGHDRANMVLGPFAETKGPRVPERTGNKCPSIETFSTMKNTKHSNLFVSERFI